MAEVLVEFDSEFEGPDQKVYSACACGREREDHLWECWLEFTPLGGGQAIRTMRESTQPNRDDAMYWATGLTTSYIDGALHRTLTLAPIPQERAASEQSTFDGPAKGRRGVGA